MLSSNKYMESITSKLRNLYVVKLFCGYLAAGFCIFICIKFINKTYSTNEIVFFFLVVIFCLLTVGSYNFLNLTKVILRKNYLELQSFLGIRKRFIDYTEIINIDRLKAIQHGKLGKISDGFYLSKITLSDGSSFILSPDKFENYNQIIIFIKSNLNSHQNV